MSTHLFGYPTCVQMANPQIMINSQFTREWYRGWPCPLPRHHHEARESFSLPLPSVTREPHSLSLHPETVTSSQPPGSWDKGAVLALPLGHATKFTCNCKGDVSPAEWWRPLLSDLGNSTRLFYACMSGMPPALQQKVPSPCPWGPWKPSRVATWDEFGEEGGR